MKIYWIFLIIAIICALCSDRIDRAVNANKKAKKIILILCGALFLVSCISIGKATLASKEIGTISGPEYDYITIDDVRYEVDYNTGFSNADKGKYLGIIRSGENTFRIDSVKGDEESQYIYRLWDWEGAFYKKIEQGDCDEKENF